MNAPALAQQTCARRLGGEPATSTISWCGDFEPDRPWSDATVQALCGLMEVHGWDAGAPCRLGLEVASVAAGILAACGELAARIGYRRDRPVARLETSVLAGGLWLVAHHIAAATADGELLASPPGPDPGPPFCSADGRWFEIEVFDAEGWRAFWEQLGAGDADLGRAWTSFRARYYRGRCTLPTGLHRATAAVGLHKVAEIATACGVSLCPVRTYAEVLAHPPPNSRNYTCQGVPARRAPADMAARPLEGVRVVEATTRMQGPLAALLLQMLGADVTRVEPPGGDVGRMVPPLAGATGSFFACYNRDKSVVEADLATPAGHADLLDLLSDTDVFLHNWRPGKAAEWRLDSDDVAATNPDLVYAEASGWHPVDDNAGLIGTDFLVQAYAGFGDGLNPPGEPPRTTRVLVADTFGALVTCEGILGALLRRADTGETAPVRTSLLQGAMAAQVHVLEPLAQGREPAGRRNGRPVWGSLDVPIGTADGDLVVSVEDDDDLTRLAGACGVEASPPTVREWLAGHPVEAGENVTIQAGVAAAGVSCDLAALASDDRLSAFFEPLDGSCRAPASPWRLSK